jgi:hypothetical protein
VGGRFALYPARRSVVTDGLPMWRIYWCVGLLLAVLARSYFGDPMHSAASTRSAAFLVVWVVAFLVYAGIMYCRPAGSQGRDYGVLILLLLTIAFEAVWPVSALHNSHAGLLAGPLAGARLGSLWAEHCRNRRGLVQ